jgi:SpoVK/Ycf46/Vps4 family AAA+-type ATPase
MLQDIKTDPDHFDLEYVSKITAGMSGSDIKEACRDAAMAPVREFMREHRGAAGKSMAPVDPGRFRGIRTDDFFGRPGSQGLPEKQRKSSASKSKSKAESPSEYEDVEDLVIESQD